MGRRQRTSLKLVIERLESRQLLAAINVSVFIDHDNSRAFEAHSDAVASNRLVYLDLNENDIQDAGEPLAATDGNGIATFSDLEPGSYRVGLLTNPSTQPQSTPITVAASAELISSSGAAKVFVSENGEHLWGVGTNGTLSRLTISPRTPSLVLDGAISASTQASDRAFLVVDKFFGQRFMRLDLVSGNMQEIAISGLLDGERIHEVANANSDLFALIDGPNGRSLARLSLDSDATSSVTVSLDRLPTTANQLRGASNSTRLLLVSDSQGGVFTLVDASNGFSSLAQLSDVSGFVDAALSADGRTVLLAQSDGVRAHELVDSEFVPTAILAEATAPLSSLAVDGRFVTGSRADAAELIVWDSDDWAPIARSRSSLGHVEQLTAISSGDAVASFGLMGVERFDLAVAATTLVQVNSSRGAAIEIGVRPIGRNHPPVGRTMVRNVNEDQRDNFAPGSLGITDPDGDNLWYSVQSPPAHGALTTAADGRWVYEPAEDYEGPDSATILAHDGQVSASFRIEWQVVGVNDAPIAITIDTLPLPEDSVPGAVAGYVSVLDVDQGADYLLTTSDPRFSIEHGVITLRSGVLDFETERQIAFQVTAIDSLAPEMTILGHATIEIINVLEPPIELRVSPAAIDEETPGAIAGEIEVVGADVASHFVFSTSDARFEVLGQTLKLRPDQQVDFESEPTIALTISAMDTANADQTTTTVATIVVHDVNEAPTDIELSGRTVETDVEGGVVGEVTVTDPDSDQHVIGVSDSRFEVVDRTLKLRDTIALARSEASPLVLTLTATDADGRSISKSFAIEVRGRSPWQNERNPLDVNGDGVVSPLDLLIVVNELNTRGAGPLPPAPDGAGEGPAIRPDTSGDGYLSPLDALLIVNELNRRRGEGEGQFAEVEPPASLSPDFWNDDDAERLRRAKIDEELESLLDQLTSEHRDR